MKSKAKKVSSKPVKVQKYLVKLCDSLIGTEKPFSSMSDLANKAISVELVKRGVKI